MRVKVRFFTRLREITDKREEEAEVEDDIALQGLLKLLEEKYGSEFTAYIRNKWGELRGDLQYLINGKSAVSLQGLNTKLKEDDSIAIVPPVGGG